MGCERDYALKRFPPQRLIHDDDLRTDYDEMAKIKEGTLYRKGNKIQVWWDKWGKETWTCPDEDQAKTNFNDMKGRWTEQSGAFVALASGHRLKSKLSKGQVVTIYEDPITEKRPEGKATLIKFHFAQWDQEYWTVRFQEDGVLRSRWVKVGG